MACLMSLSHFCAQISPSWKKTQRNLHRQYHSGALEGNLSHAVGPPDEGSLDIVHKRGVSNNKLFRFTLLSQHIIDVGGDVCSCVRSAHKSVTTP